MSEGEEQLGSPGDSGHEMGHKVSREEEGGFRYISGSFVNQQCCVIALGGRIW
jgi:hypothetical protein